MVLHAFSFQNKHEMLSNSCTLSKCMPFKHEMLSNSFQIEPHITVIVCYTMYFTSSWWFLLENSGKYRKILDILILFHAPADALIIGVATFRLKVSGRCDKIFNFLHFQAAAGAVKIFNFL